MDEPLDSINAKRRIRHIIDNGTVQWTNHALQRLSERRLTTVDCVNVLRAGVVDWARVSERDVALLRAWRLDHRRHRVSL